ncbi:MAG: hypothetical protein ACKO7C_06445 [Bacteroidota bacterium]
MKKVIYFLVLSALMYQSCMNSNTPPVASKSNELVGTFEDTLWTNDGGFTYQLKLKQDSSFYLYTKKLGSKEGVKTFLGRYEPNADWSSIQLKSTDGQLSWKCDISSMSQLKLSTDLGESVLDRTVAVIERSNELVVCRRLLPNRKDRSLVFQRTDDHELILDEAFLAQLTGEQKAVLAYYAFRYETGCVNGTCWLTKMLGYNSNDLRNVLSLFLNADSLKKPWYAAPIENEMKPQLKTAFVQITSNGMVIQYVAMGSQGNAVSFVDEWRLNNLQWSITSHQAAGVSTAVLYEGNADVQLPKDQIIINVQK